MDDRGGRRRRARAARRSHGAGGAQASVRRRARRAAAGARQPVGAAVRAGNAEPAAAAARAEARRGSDASRSALPTLEFGNGYGGFAADGREYVVALEPGMDTPAPWVNVLANPGFGSVVSASGAAFSWAREQPREPAHRRGRTIRSAIRRPKSLYLRDEETGDVWTPTAHPIRLPDRRYVARTRPGLQPLRASAHAACAPSC